MNAQQQVHERERPEREAAKQRNLEAARDFRRRMDEANAANPIKLRYDSHTGKKKTTFP